MRVVLGVLMLAACETTSLDHPNTALTPATHDKFPIAAGTAHGAVDCNTCHGAFDSFAQFDCLNGCHAAADTAPAHTAVPSYKYESAACYSCHPDGKGVDHSLIFPIGPGTQHDLACSTCHTNPNDRTVFTCIDGGCHPQAETDGHHQDVGGYMYISANCFGCHYRGKK